MWRSHLSNAVQTSDATAMIQHTVTQIQFGLIKWVDNVHWQQKSCYHVLNPDLLIWSPLNHLLGYNICPHFYTQKRAA